MPAESPAELSLPLARAILAALATATRHRPPLACAIVDGAGHLVAFQRPPTTPFLTGEIAFAKARTAALLERPTVDSQAGAAARPELYGTLAKLSGGPMVHVAGGIPICTKRGTIGAIGVSGASPEEDERYARQALQAAIPADST